MINKTEISDKGKAAIFKRAKGRCECKSVICGHKGRCEHDLVEGYWEAYPKSLIGSFGHDEMSNFQALCITCYNILVTGKNTHRF
jgi:hypothetical protein